MEPEQPTPSMDSEKKSKVPDVELDTTKRKRPRKVNKGRVDPQRKAGMILNVAGNYRGKKSADELLTDEQKKKHHIASEQKRRRNIKLGYDRLSTLVPALKKEVANTNINPSETVILQRSVEYMQSLLQTRSQLEADVQALRDEIVKSNSKVTCSDG